MKTTTRKAFFPFWVLWCESWALDCLFMFLSQQNFISKPADLTFKVKGAYILGLGCEFFSLRWWSFWFCIFWLCWFVKVSRIILCYAKPQNNLSILYKCAFRLYNLLLWLILSCIFFTFLEAWNHRVSIFCSFSSAVIFSTCLSISQQSEWKGWQV